MLELFLALALGICAGIVTGLVPGVHVNLVSASLLSFSAALLNIVDTTTLAVFIIAMAVVHTFLDTIPSIYLGAPDTANVMAVLPGHRMLLEGKGYDAVKMTIIGSFLSLIIVVASAPLLVTIMSALQTVLEPWIGWLLVLMMAWMISREKKPLVAAFLFLVTGIMGISVLGLRMTQPLFPMLSGLFGVSTLLISLNEQVKIPVQKISTKLALPWKTLLPSVGVGSFVGTLGGFFPGLGPAQAAVIGSQLLPEKRNNFLVLVGGIGTANMVASLVTFYALDKARNGAIVTVRELIGGVTWEQFLLFLIVALISGSVGVVLTLFFAKHFARWMEKVKYSHLCLGVIAFIAVLVPIISGWMGLLVLIVATSAGMIAPLTNVSRSNAMGCLLVPVILWFLL